MSGKNTALHWFLEDAEAQGLTLSEYERKYGIILPSGRFDNPAQARINRNERPSGLMTDVELRLAEHTEKRRSEDRRLTDLLIDAVEDDDSDEPS